MKKTLVALAIAGAFTGAAYAQSSVTLYGIIDGGIQVNDPKAGTSTNAPGITGFNSGIQSGSRWGFRGTEALGGGLNAIFQLENGFSHDSGQLGQGGRLFGRQAYVGVSSGMGTLVAGRLALFSSGTGSFDKFGYIADIGSTGFGAAGTQSVMTSSAAMRVDNAIAYISPKFAGFSGGWMHSFRLDGQEVSGNAPKNSHGDSAYVDFGMGPFLGVVTYDRFSCEEGSCQSLSSGDRIEEHLQIGAQWNFGFMKLMGAYAMEKNLVNNFGFGTGTYAPTVQNAGLQSSGQDADAFSIGAVFPWGAHSFAANYQQRKWDSNAKMGSAKRETWAFEYQYAFSKRTNLYAYYTEVSDKDAAKTASWGGLQQYALGLRHQF